MRKAEAILARFPGPVTLHAIRPKAYVLFAACVGGLAIAAYMLFAAADYRGNLGGMLAAWFAILVFGFGALVGAVGMLPGSSSLTLAADGFELRNLFQRSRTSWHEVTEFRVMELDEGAGRFSGMGRVVSYESRTSGIRPGLERRGPTMVRTMLPGQYRLPKEDLAWLMTQWRSRALAQRQ